MDELNDDVDQAEVFALHCRQYEVDSDPRRRAGGASALLPP